MIDKKVFLYITLLLAGFSVGYFLNRSINKQIPTLKQTENIVVKSQEIPECLLGRCPEYLSRDVDGDGLSESLVIIPTAMTQGAGKLWVIDDGKAIFDSGEMMRIWVNQSPEEEETGNGFTLHYREEVNSSKLTEKHFRFINGQFDVVSSRE